MEMAKLDKNLPRYYRGYDVDNLLKKAGEWTSTEEEDNILLELYNTYGAKAETIRNKKFNEEIEKAYKEGRIIGPWLR